jgi:hypothetical protein
MTRASVCHLDYELQLMGEGVLNLGPFVVTYYLRTSLNHDSYHLSQSSRICFLVAGIQQLLSCFVLFGNSERGTSLKMYVNRDRHTHSAQQAV